MNLNKIQQIVSISYYLVISVTAIYGVFSFKKWFKPKQFEKLEEMFYELKKYIDFIIEIEVFLKNWNDNLKNENYLEGINKFLRLDEELNKKYNNLVYKYYFSKIYFKNAKIRKCLTDMFEYLLSIYTLLNTVINNIVVSEENTINWDELKDEFHEIRFKLTNVYKELSDLEIF